MNKIFFDYVLMKIIEKELNIFCKLVIKYNLLRIFLVWYLKYGILKRYIYNECWFNNLMLKYFCYLNILMWLVNMFLKCWLVI